MAIGQMILPNNLLENRTAEVSVESPLKAELIYLELPTNCGGKTWNLKRNQKRDSRRRASHISSYSTFFAISGNNHIFYALTNDICNYSLNN